MTMNSIHKLIAEKLFENSFAATSGFVRQSCLKGRTAFKLRGRSRSPAGSRKQGGTTPWLTSRSEHVSPADERERKRGIAERQTKAQSSPDLHESRDTPKLRSAANNPLI